jgi:hypothetical protein
MPESNYFKIPYDNLPSLGKLYPRGSSIRFRILQIRDLKYLASMDEKNATDLVDDILRRCLIVDGMKIEEIYKMDRLSILFYLRRNTFILSNGYQTEFVCPYCSSRVNKSFQVHELAKKTIEDSKLRKVYIDCDGTRTEFRGEYRRLFDPEYRTGENDVDLILNWTNADIIYQADVSEYEAKRKILSIPADQFAKLKHLASDARCGILSYTDLTCDKCMNQMRVGVSLSDDKLFNRVQLSTMVRNQIQVSKYCGIVITDDMPYNEVELTIAIVNDMSKKEAEDIQKSKNKGARR